MTTRKEFTGMLPGAITKFEALLAEVAALNPVIVKGYDVTQGKDSFYYWGVACRITIAQPDNAKFFRRRFQIVHIIRRDGRTWHYLAGRW